MLPIMLKISGWRTVVVGAGTVGLRKARQLLIAGAFVRLVDRQIHAAAELQALDPERIELCPGEYETKHLQDCRMVVVALPTPQNRLVREDARRAGILVCDAAEPEEGDWTFPAVHRSEQLLLALTTGVPAMSRQLRADLANYLEFRYHQHLDALLRTLTEARAVLIAEQRAEELRELGSFPWLDWLANLGPEQTLARLEDWLARARANPRIADHPNPT
jgi:siroheme synthase-like protein